jgi:hypothetical protein
MTYTFPTKKAQIVLLMMQGVSEKEIAEKYSVDRATVTRSSKDTRNLKTSIILRRNQAALASLLPMMFALQQECWLVPEHMMSLISEDSISPICMPIRSGRGSPNAD